MPGGVEKMPFSPLMNRVDENGTAELNASEIQLQETEAALMNSSLMSGNSRESNAFKSKSQARARRGYGRILQNNMSEVASYIQDGMVHDQKSKHSYSRYDVISHNESKEKMGGRDRNQNISRLLGKQQSEARLAALQMAKGRTYGNVDHRHNSLSSSIIDREGQYHSSRAVRKADGLIEDSIASSQTNPVKEVEGSFSYLPSIYGIGKAKAHNVSSVEMTRRSKQFGPHSLTGKKPVLLANYRRQKHQNQGLPGMGETSSSSIRDGAIRLVDPMRARELVINEQESKEVSKKLSLQDVSVPTMTH